MVGMDRVTITLKVADKNAVIYEELQIGQYYRTQSMHSLYDA